MNARAWLSFFRTPVLTMLTLGCILAIMPSATSRAEPHCLTLHSLKKLSECELTRLFENGAVGEIPIGYGRGEVLMIVTARMPRVRARLAGSAWKGKLFEEDGEFINQWLGVKALRSKAGYGTSWHDGKPCILIEYPTNTPLFGNTRDEIREIAPGLYLARLYDRCPCPHFRGYFAFQIECGK